MCHAASAQGIEGFKRNTFMWSLANAPREIQVELHAIAEQAGQRLAWSYSASDWYVIPAGTSANVDAPDYICP
jgi:hypothetical protein